MILAICHDFACPSIFESQSYTLVPHLPSLTRLFPESPVYWENDDLANLKLAKNCSTDTYAILVDMRWLTEAFLARYNICGAARNEGPADMTLDFDEVASRIYTRLIGRPSIPSDLHYEIVRLTSMIYATSLLRRIPFLAASTLLSPEVPETIAAYLTKTDLVTCWGGGMAGVMFFCTLIGAAAACALRNASGRRAARWFRTGAMYCMILLSTEHAEAFSGTAGRLLAVQRILRPAYRAIKA
jgi:hypothetical protein